MKSKSSLRSNVIWLSGFLKSGALRSSMIDVFMLWKRTKSVVSWEGARASNWAWVVDSNKRHKALILWEKTLIFLEKKDFFKNYRTRTFFSLRSSTWGSFKNAFS